MEAVDRPFLPWLRHYRILRYAFLWYITIYLVDPAFLSKLRLMLHPAFLSELAAVCPTAISVPADAAAIDGLAEVEGVDAPQPAFLLQFRTELPAGNPALALTLPEVTVSALQLRD
jgi:hypothetical protein